MDNVNKANLLASSVMRVRFFFLVARNFPDQLRWWAGVGGRVNLRIEAPSRNNASQVLACYYTESNRAGIVAMVAAIKQFVPLEAVTCGNEAEIENDLRRSDDPNANWGDKPEPLFPKGRAGSHDYTENWLSDEDYSLCAVSDLSWPGWPG